MFILEQFRNYFISFSHQVRVCWGPPFATMTIAQLWFYIDFPPWFCVVLSCGFESFLWPGFLQLSMSTLLRLPWHHTLCWPLILSVGGVILFFVHSMLSSWRSNINQLVWQFNLVILILNCLQHGLVLVFVNCNSTCFDVFGSKLNLL